MELLRKRREISESNGTYIDGQGIRSCLNVSSLSVLYDVILRSGFSVTEKVDFSYGFSRKIFHCGDKQFYLFNIGI